MKHYLRWERLGLIESFRRFWSGVRYKSSCYCQDLELSHIMKSDSHHPFVPIHYSLVLLKRLFSVLGTIDDCALISQKKKYGLVLHTEGLPLRFPTEYSIYTQTEYCNLYYYWFLFFFHFFFFVKRFIREYNGRT